MFSTMADQYDMQNFLSNTSFDNTNQFPPYTTYRGSSSQQPFNIPPHKKPRGRPPGSKNKPKPPFIITQENDQAMKPLIIDVSAGTDVLEAIIQYGIRHRTGICVLSGSGTIIKATLRFPISCSPFLTLHGPFSLISLTGTYMHPRSPPTSSSSSNPKPPEESTFGITLAGVQGQIFGGVIGGKVVAGGDGVKVMCSMFRNPEHHRAGGVKDAGEEGDDNDDGGDENDNVIANGEEGVGSSAGGAGFNVVNRTPLNLVPYDPSFMQWTHPRPPNF